MGWFGVFAILFVTPAYAQQTVDPNTIDRSAAKPLTNQKLAPRINDLARTSLKVKREEEGIVYLTITNQSYAEKTQILFVRKVGTRIEIIGTGTVTTERGVPHTNQKELVVQIDRDAIVKYPQAGDLAVPLSDPNSSALGDKKQSTNYLSPDEKKKEEPNDRPGYFEFGEGVFFGNFTTESSTQANDSKKIGSYRFKNTHLAYYSEFFPIGIELDSHGGTFPTSTYYQTAATSTESVSTFALNYRFKSLFNQHFRLTARVVFLSDTFTTTNPDEHAIGTKTSGTGFGLRAAYNLVPDTWVKKKNESFFQLQNFFGEYTLYPSVSPVDAGPIVRGMSDGSSGSEYRIGTTALVWINFIPILKRWVFQASYGKRSYNLKFSGATTSENAGGAYQIPPGGTSKESEGDYRFFVGFRLDDPINMLIHLGDKKPSVAETEKKP